MDAFKNLERELTTNLELKISPACQKEAWERAQHHSNAVARYSAYVNEICSHTFRSWLEEWLAEESLPHASIWPSEGTLPTIWEAVTGTALEVGTARLVLIPIEDADAEECFVPQEWVDIPSWKADYYLPVEVSLEGDEDECWMRVWGFATHRQIKYGGKYSPLERAYFFAVEELTEDLTVLQATLGLCMQEEVEELPPLSQAEAVKLLQVLGDSSVYSPRLRVEVPFEKWAALLASDEWRQQLYSRRLGIAPASRKWPVNLGQWFQNIFDAAWQTVEEILEGAGTQEANLAYSFGGAERFRNRASSAQNAIPTLIELLQESQDKGTHRRVVDLLGHIAPGNAEAIVALSELLRNTQDDDVRRQAAVSLGKIDPGNPAAGVRRARVIDLGMRIGDHQVVLVVTLMPEPDLRINTHWRVYPAGSQTYLPPGLQLEVLDEVGETVLSVQSRNADNAIQLAFRGERGDSFRVRVALGDTCVTEDFVL
ncbi:MAG: DUF1822 family protein [Oscillatoria princeps RMCB-10]|jgi:hypothetical protein|nr:DUF1822 family protein [Oscillatoria princeps RMCB-10]